MNDKTQNALIILFMIAIALFALVAGYSSKNPPQWIYVIEWFIYMVMIGTVMGYLLTHRPKDTDSKITKGFHGYCVIFVAISYLISSYNVFASLNGCKPKLRYECLKKV